MYFYGVKNTNKLSKSKNILIAPLKWGLGHATRCIPLIRKWQSEGHRVLVASDGDALLLLQKEFPKLIFEDLPAYDIRYASRPFWNNLKLLLQFFKIKKAVRLEHQKTKELVEKYQLDLIVSDNRFGVRDKRVKSVYITHQLRVLSGVTTFLTSFFHRRIYKKFDEIWVPDMEGDDGLSGRLGHIYSGKLPVKYIGVQSRFRYKKVPIQYDYLAILSGPEPQRSQLEAILLRELPKLQKKTALVRGVVEDEPIKYQENGLTVYNYLTSDDLEQLINASSVVVGRSGYSSIMDYYQLQKKVFFIPTPGQPEQIYLAKYLSSKGIANYSKQADFDIKKLFDNKRHRGFAT